MEEVRDASALRASRLSVPGPGRTVQLSMQPWEEPLLSAFRVVVNAANDPQFQQEISKRYQLTFFPVLHVGGRREFSTEVILQLASSAVLSVWMLAMSYHSESKALTFAEAEAWFLGRASTEVPGIVLNKQWPPEEVTSLLTSVDYGQNFKELFPYLLELFQVSYGSVGVSEGQKLKAETHKRRHGVFYTPSDVAEFIVENTLEPWFNGQNLRENWLPKLLCLDPACGAGAFLLAILYIYNEHCQNTNTRPELLSLAVQSLYGIDKSPQAIQSCAFAVLNACLDEVQSLGLAPWRAWQAIRGNLAIADSTLLLGRGIAEAEVGEELARRRLIAREQMLDPDAVNFSAQSGFEARIPRLPSQGTRSLGGWLENDLNYRYLGDLFPECSGGFSAILGNPPYIGNENDGLEAIRSRLFVSAPDNGGKAGNLYTLFVEMMWLFASPDYARAGMILPLSIAYHSGQCFRTLRTAIENSRFNWRFAFFDRTPDSLFGDSVKTRNAIAFMGSEQNGKKQVETGTLVRWNSRNRAQLFSSITYAEIDGLSIRDRIPKLGTKLEVEVYRTLREKPKKSGLFWRDLPRSALAHTSGQCVYYYSTAYNWLSIFRHLPLDKTQPDVPAYSNSLRGVVCNSSSDADFLFAVASSRIAYWLWRVEGDGFHLNKGFLARLPFHRSEFSSSDLEKLGELANALWQKLIQFPIYSVNAGRRTINFSPQECGELIDEIDQVLIRILGLPEEFKDFLKNFVEETVVAGRQDEFDEIRLSKEVI